MHKYHLIVPRFHFWTRNDIKNADWMKKISRMRRTWIEQHRHMENVTQITIINTLAKRMKTEWNEKKRDYHHSHYRYCQTTWRNFMNYYSNTCVFSLTCLYLSIYIYIFECHKRCQEFLFVFLFCFKHIIISVRLGKTLLNGNMLTRISIKAISFRQCFQSQVIVVIFHCKDSYFRLQAFVFVL